MTTENDRPATPLQVVRPWAVLVGVGLFITAVVCHVQGQARAGQVGNERLLERAAQAQWRMVTLPMIFVAAGVTTLAFGFDKELTPGAYPFATGIVVCLVLLLTWFAGWAISPRVSRAEATLRTDTSVVRLPLPPGWVFVHGGRQPEKGGTLLDDQERARLSVDLNATRTMTGPTEFWDVPGGRVAVRKTEADSDYAFVGFLYAVGGKVRKVIWWVRLDGFSLTFSGLKDDEEQLRPVIREMLRSLKVASEGAGASR